MAIYFDDVQGDVASIFLSYFQRAPEFDAMQHYVGVLQALQANPETADNAFNLLAAHIYADGVASQEVPAGPTVSDTWYVNYLYSNVLGRAADAEGLTYWVARLEAGDIARAELVGTFVASALASEGRDADYLINRTEVAVEFAQWENSNPQILPTLKYNAADVLEGVNETAASVEAAQERLADYSADVGQTYTLTTSPDNILGTVYNDTINGYVNTSAAGTTFTAADVINGNGGTDVMMLTVEGTAAASLPNATISNVEIFAIRDVATAASTYDFGNIEGEQEVWANTATNVVDFQNLGKGTTVGLMGNNVLTTLGNVLFDMATATDAVSIAIEGGVKNTVAPTITATAGSATEAKISSEDEANTVGAITLTAASNSIKTLTVDAESNLTAVLVATDYAADAKLVVTGGGKVNLSAGFDGATIDASGNTGGLTLSTVTGATKSVTGSAGADTITLVGALAAGGSINLGAGNDKLLAGTAGTIAAKNVVDGGEGTDSIAASLVNAANAANIKNFEALDLTHTGVAFNLDVDLMTGSKIEALTLSGAGTGLASVSNVGVGVGLTVVGANTGVSTINVKGATAATDNTFAVAFNGAAVAAAPVAANVTAGTIVVNKIENVTIDSAGGANTWNSITLTDDLLQTVKITGDKNLDLAFAGVNGTNSGTNGGAVNLIDGSEASGRLNINTTNVTADSKAGVGLTVKGGSGNDTITLAQKATVDAGAGNDTITVSATGGALTGGAGNDTFVATAAVAGATAAATAVMTGITDFSAGDKITGLAAANALTKITLGATVQDLDTAFGLLAANTDAQWFNYGTDTYVVFNDGVAGLTAADVVVKLTGVQDLSTATVAAGDLTLA